MIVNSSREVAIETPEGVRFALSLAGPGARFAAWTIDLLVISTATTMLGRAMMVLQFAGPDAVAAVTAIGYFVISVGYGIAAEWLWRGQTIGKRVMHLRVVDAQGLQLRPSQIVIRNLLRFVDALPALYFVGGAAVLLTRDAQRLGDMAANTIVIRQRGGAQFNIATVTTGPYNSLLENRPLAARLRQKAGPELVAIAYEALARRDEIDPAARVEIFRRTAAELKKLVKFPEPLTEGMTDEQYVRAALEVIYSRT